MAKGYQINEKDIDSVLNFLKIHDPDNATPDMAIEILEAMQAKFHEMAHTDPEILRQILEDLKKQKKILN
ncbi:MAG TPA: hypothetical protein VEW42_05295 [Candidatus Eisenbacteria bacterium]|nr:hypothetical protein [Candidatus Eisenbacteria bacterium]